jgi:hypothetical protein
LINILFLLIVSIPRLINTETNLYHPDDELSTDELNAKVATL